MRAAGGWGKPSRGASSQSHDTVWLAAPRPTPQDHAMTQAVPAPLLFRYAGRILADCDAVDRRAIVVALRVATADMPAAVDFVVTDLEEIERRGGILGSALGATLRERTWCTTVRRPV